MHMRIKRLGFSDWHDVHPGNGTEPFHSSEQLRVLDRHTSGKLHLLGGFKGEQPVGLLPVHEQMKYGARLLTSPPLGLGIGRLGPLVMSTSPKQRKRESTNQKFTEAALDTLDADSPRTLLRFACSPQYTDPRPFQWQNFTVQPAFTYQLELADPDTDELMSMFSRDLRREVRKQDEVDFSITKGGLTAVRQIFKALEERYQNQDYKHPLSWGFVRDLYETLEDTEQLRVYVARSNSDEFLAGMIILYVGDTAYFWKGGNKTDRTISPNSLLHWRVLRDILTDPALNDIETYDFYAANNKRLTRYKSKFGGTPKPYFIIESGGPAMSAAKGIYRLTELGKHPLGQRGKL